MNSFNFLNPTKIIFGENAINNLANEVKNYKNILFTYGGGSIKKNGIYNKVIQILKNENKNVMELDGIMPNPRKEKANYLIECSLGIEKQIMQYCNIKPEDINDESIKDYIERLKQYDIK